MPGLRGGVLNKRPRRLIEKIRYVRSSNLARYLIENVSLRRRRLFPFRKRSLPFWTLDAIIGTKPLTVVDVIYALDLVTIRQQIHF